MHTSTKDFVKRCLRKLMSQCDISTQDIQKALDEIKHPLGCQGYHDVEAYYKDD